MMLKLVRVTNAPDYTEGKLYVDGAHECYTIEDTDRFLEERGRSAKIYGKTAIPRGMYPVVISYSPRFKKELIEIKDVPHFEGIRIHTGNTAEDTEGCIIVGSMNESDDDGFVGNSKKAYEKLHEKVEEALEKEDEVWLEVV